MIGRQGDGSVERASQWVETHIGRQEEGLETVVTVRSVPFYHPCSLHVSHPPFSLSLSPSLLQFACGPLRPVHCCGPTRCTPNQPITGEALADVACGVRVLQWETVRMLRVLLIHVTNIE